MLVCLRLSMGLHRRQHQLCLQFTMAGCLFSLTELCVEGWLEAGTNSWYSGRMQPQQMLPGCH
uniref:Uncharacterized protein n=1 Tax=Arundo donax TaxID=35708 RepID=A0A0A9B1L9_ARUDO